MLLSHLIFFLEILLIFFNEKIHVNFIFQNAVKDSLIIVIKVFQVIIGFKDELLYHTWFLYFFDGLILAPNPLNFSKYFF
jgi:hypothetical protein